jgi:acetyl-CoA acyltransferase
MAKLKPVFAAKGSVTAATSVADVGRRRRADRRQREDPARAQPDAAGQVLVVRGARRAAGDHGHRPEGGDPGALAAAGITQDQLDWIELNEAFAAQALAVIRDLGLDTSKVNPMGGAIALGHPLGATGAIRAATVVHALRRNNLKYGMVTMCVGTGMGAAGIIERV